jgi:hypothetical protein
MHAERDAEGPAEGRHILGQGLGQGTGEMGMGIDEARQDGVPLGVDDPVGIVRWRASAALVPTAAMRSPSIASAPSGHDRGGGRPS